MSATAHTLKVRLTIICGRTNVTMERGRIITYAPSNGDVIRIWNEDNTEYHDLALCNLVYDNGEFIEEIEDDELVPKIVDKTLTQEDLVELVKYYQRLGFERKTWHQGVAI